jgi:RNA polymerase sigma factor (sigma-70 family)
LLRGINIIESWLVLCRVQLDMNEEHIHARFEILILPLMNDAYNLARWLMRNPQDAEDMVQESYLRAFKFFKSFHEGTNPKAWLLRIVRNTCYTALAGGEKKRREVPLEEETNEIPDASPSPLATLSKQATIEAVRAAIAELDVDFRETIVLRELEGLSYKEISEVIDVPIGTVMSRLSRGRSQLVLILFDRRTADQL